MTHFMIPMVAGDKRDQGYGIRAKSAFVYDTTKSHYPTRLVLWDNTGRPNKRNGEPVSYTNYGPRDGGNGRWLDPSNRATDDMLTMLLTTESIGISSDTSMNTGQPGSGQVYAPAVGKMGDGDTATLIYDRAGFGDVEVTLHFPPHRNGHGFATFGVDRTPNAE